MEQTTTLTRESEQARALRRKLSLRLLRDWLAFSLVFIAAAMLFNTYIIPMVADDVANSVSKWHYYDKKDYPLESCLNTLNARLLAVYDNWDDPEMLEIISKDVEANESQRNSQDAESTDELLAQGYVDSQMSVGVPGGVVVTDTSPLLVTIDRKQPQWTTLDDLRIETVRHNLGAQNADNWQVLENGDSIEARDLSTYYSLRQLKIPVALGIYLLGCLIIVFAGYGRSLRYFDELSGAVAGLLEDRTKPVKLTSDLLITQDELNTIRLSSLADERAAEAAETRKDELVAYLAHDIKTPLTSVMGYLMLLDEVPDMPAEIRQRYIRTACEKAERLEELTDEFFEITRYNLHAIPIEREHVDLTTLCMQVAEEFYPASSAKGLTIDVKAPEKMQVFVDPDKFARALENVVRNAVAYADADSIVYMAAHPLEDGGFTIEVSDHGREISPEHLSRIFEKFYREDSSRHARSGNSGLGLAIAREIVTAHKGEITAASTDGLTTFTIVIPERADTPSAAITS